MTSENRPPLLTPAPKCRITIVENVNHEHPDFDPTSVEYKNVSYLETDEQPYSRRTKLGPRWIRLDTGWLEDASEVCLENVGKQPIHISFSIPVASDPRDMHSPPPVEIFYTPWLILSPRKSCRFQPSMLNSILVRAEDESILVVNIFPR